VIGNRPQAAQRPRGHLAYSADKRAILKVVHSVKVTI
jgi:hypothetical protein